MNFKVQFPLRWHLLVIFLVLYSLVKPLSFAQTVGRETSVSTIDKTVPVDLGRLARSSCVESLKEKINGSVVEVRFPAGFSKQANQVAQMVSDMVKDTQRILQPLRIEDVRVYLLPLSERPSSYTYKLPPERGVYQTVELLSSLDQPADCRLNYDLCDDIFHVAPHELTHGATHYLFRETMPWFEEGLAEYVAWLVAAGLAPPIAEGVILARSPEAALHCSEVRHSLFSWKNSETDVKQIMNPKLAWETNAMYGAAFQLVRLLVNRAEQAGLKDPLRLLLKSLVDFHAGRRKIRSSQELFNLTEQSLRVDVRQLGVLTVQEQGALLRDAAKNLIARDNPQRELYALNIFACIDMEVDKTTLAALMRVAFSDDRFALERRIAATALISRFHQPGFDETLKSFLNGPNNSKGYSSGDAKKVIRSLALRVPARSMTQRQSTSNNRLQPTAR